MSDRINIQIVSDLHIPEDIPVDFREYFTVSAPYLIIAGDICTTKNKVLYKQFIRSICLEYKIVFLVAGNHEYYSYCEKFEDIRMFLHSLQIDISNLYFLDNTYYDLPDSDVRIYGTTLWSDAIHGRKKLPINSYYGDAGTGNWFKMMHYDSLYKTEQIMVKSYNEKKRLIIATHYPPTKKHTVYEYQLSSLTSSYYINNLDDYLIKEYVYIWIYGHTHVNSDYFSENNCRVLSNQYRANFYNPQKIIKL